MDSQLITCPIQPAKKTRADNILDIRLSYLNYIEKQFVRIVNYFEFIFPIIKAETINTN